MQFDIEFIRMAAGLLILILVNIILGSAGAIFEQKFELKKFFKGFAKGALVTVCAVAFYAVGLLNPEVIPFTIGGVEMNIIMATKGLVLAGYALYAAQVIAKLAVMVGVKDFLVGKKTEEKPKTK